MLKKASFGGVLTGTLISTMMHTSLVGGVYYWVFMREPAPIVAELDLSQTPLVPQDRRHGRRHHRKPPPDWIVAKKEKAVVPVPVKAIPPPVETKEEVKAEEEAPAPCVDCTETAPVEGNGDYIEAADAARKPRWVRNFITSRDYPVLARQEGKDGRVLLTVIIGADGLVKDARLLEGSYDVLNEVALRKVSAAVFTPAYDANNKAVSCKVTLPIRFEIR